ncbi:MAG: glycosyl transferase family 1 [Desulfovibrio sp.]|nr:glycosyl transferase family 1 [Desulfovibrio sp.]
MNTGASASTLVLVLGMHRSGTSALTRGLRVLGADLGEGALGTSYNPRGLFEDVQMVRMDDALLADAGLNWKSLAAPAPDRLSELAQGSAGMQALAFLQTRSREAAGRAANADAGLLAFKDPRLCRLMPFWRPIAAAAKLSLTGIIVLRHPASVAASLAARDGMDAPTACALWTAYTVDAVRHTQGMPRICVSYDLLLSEPRRQMQRLGHFLEAKVDETELSAFTEGFLDNALRHHTEAEAAAPASPEERQAYAVYELLSPLAASPDGKGLDEPRLLRRIAKAYA